MISVVWLIPILMLSAFFSSAETALASVNRLRLLHQSEAGDARASRVFRLLQRYEETLTSILIGNTIVNVAFILFGGWWIIQFVETIATQTVAFLALFFLLLLFGELIPKSYAREHTERYVLLIGRPLRFFLLCFRPLVFLLLRLRQLALRLIGADPKGPLVTEQELKALVDISQEEGIMGLAEAELVHQAVDFQHATVEDALTPRMDIQAIDIDARLEDIIVEVQKGGYSRLPVYKDSIDHVIGVLSERDFLRAYVKNGSVDIREWIRPVSFVVPQTRLMDLLPELKVKQSHMAVVLDEFGGTAGLITLEDILEEIVGEIWDEHDESLEYTKRIGPEQYECLAEYDIEDFCQQFQLTMPDTDAQSLGGWIMEESGQLPDVGTAMRYERVTLTVLHIENRRVRKVLATFDPPATMLETPLEPIER
ncbi:hemolysin family protein [Exiguobacterium sp. LL15]|uniref:hemolysin family protein n=1 Tax=Exiguobacterium sp. LL15 TaxID=2950547 RepID=UPI00210F1EBC|nr:hemolysin family protein [Exiguobacterium sp. LL15]MCQ4089663.1 hemolysin family protein [Exiguobacterium sp. LL15]